jgi:excisionase family DNA binding protein
VVNEDDKNRQLGQRVLTLQEVRAKIGLSKTTIYDLIKLGQLPSPIKFGRKSLWPESELDEVLKQKRAERDSANRP